MSGPIAWAMVRDGCPIISATTLYNLCRGEIKIATIFIVTSPLQLQHLKRTAEESHPTPGKKTKGKKGKEEKEEPPRPTPRRNLFSRNHYGQERGGGKVSLSLFRTLNDDEGRDYCSIQQRAH